MDELSAYLLNQNNRALELQTCLTAFPAIGPENGGQGELAKAEFVESILGNAKINFQRYDSPDPRVESGKRPNIVAIAPGRANRKLWLFGHLDVVPPGDLSTWDSDPWIVRHDGDLIYGRGVEDNQQAVTSMLLLAEALSTLRITPELGLGLVFMADEERGSGHGLAWLLRTAPHLFQPEDYYIVPDGGSPDATQAEIAEKAQLWLRFIIGGRQCHASTPAEGVNALTAASRVILAEQELARIFPERDNLFIPPVSTFTPTLHEANVPAINILPGKDIFYMDCRILPEVNPDAVLSEAARIASKIAENLGATATVEIVHSQQSSSTPADCPCMLALKDAVKQVYGVELRPVGIGGATVAAMLREKGLAAVVWSKIFNTCHQANECSSLSATCGDAAVFGRIISGAA